MGAYIDGFNPGGGLDVRALVERVAARRWIGRTPRVSSVVYCTARISGPAEAAHKQDAYLQALRLCGSVDHIEEGHFVERYAEYPRATRDSRGRPELVSTPGGRLDMVGVPRREEKGSDVNIASHLLRDALLGYVDAAIVVSNDSDLALPVRMLRERGLPLGTVNPRPGRPSVVTDLLPAAGCHGSWYDQLRFDDYRQCQLPPVCGEVRRPPRW